MTFLRILTMAVIVFLPNLCNSTIVTLEPGTIPGTKSASGNQLQSLNEDNKATGSKASVIAHLRKNSQKTYYYGWVEVGTPHQKVLVCFDTGSTDFWVLSSAICKKETSHCKKHRTYDKTKSKTFRKDGRPFHIKYLIGETNGIVVKDDISVPGLKVKQQIFAEATEISNDSKVYTYDGVLGLGFATSSIIPADPPFVNMIKQKVVK